MIEIKYSNGFFTLELLTALLIITSICTGIAIWQAQMYAWHHQVKMQMQAVSFAYRLCKQIRNNKKLFAQKTDEEGPFHASWSLFLIHGELQNNRSNLNIDIITVPIMLLCLTISWKESNGKEHKIHVNAPIAKH